MYQHVCEGGASLRASLALLPLLGITWLFGFLAISNGTLGTFVFYYHCLKYKDVKNYYRRFLTKCRITVSSMKISDGSKSHNTRAKEEYFKNSTCVLKFIKS
ncbi:uncharacterized protein TRIADDRAFT_59349 [Trichoplax adhaerens]|uniref:G-protein coupled receptors family 2 profile 2 domain-containing protein n=1 Tax=Trichoplax adhaerens TaxID=10228 RepID=B3S4U4_TRIAD|nr:predicted protein [Trichoplax adhaerens]EDV22149.1 predicted protein [Trichoplax adhaerens]|eukprot:XP_002115304.1 predicted protein [Trichoplax adhaerens]